MTYTGVASIHAFALALLLARQPEIIDLDILAAFLILGVSIVILWPLLHFNAELKGHRLEMLIKLWIVLVDGGAVSAAVGMNVFLRAEGQACVLPVAPFDNHTFAGDFDPYAYAVSHCNLTCTDQTPLLRMPSSLQSFLLEEKLDSKSAITAFQCFVLTAATYNVLTIFLPPGIIALPLGFQIPPKVVDALLFKHSGIQGSIAAAAALGVIFAEIYLTEFPEEDSARTVGQWGSWAATLLLGLSAGVGHWLAMRRAHSRRKQASKICGVSPA